jgi:phage gp36-like protein
MPYATQNDLLQRMTLVQLTQLTDDSNTGQPDATVVSGALEEASGRVDAYCRERYVTPLQPSDTVTTVTRDVAVYFLFSRRPQKMSDVVRQRYEDAMALLKDISAGKAVLDQPVSAAEPQSTTAGATLPTCSKLRFRDHDIEGFV